MYNYSELNAVQLSPTKKDYYQVWNELLETASKLSERWDPTSTNESDPGIVLLKVLTAVADKLNYTIDANTLEAFMPSAAQEESMRKLCDMLGYEMQYYKSAVTQARIAYKKSSSDFEGGASVVIDQFTNLKDVDGLINYVTLEPIILNKTLPSQVVECIEGELVKCETDEENLVTINHLDDNNRYYLPETMIASNGIFVKSAIDLTIQEAVNVDWSQISNLNTVELGTKAYKFGYDSNYGLPYLEFPSDIKTLIGDGLYISYIRTKGTGGNISVNTLSSMEKPESWSTDTTANDGSQADLYEVDNYSVTNISAASNGANPETIDSAYFNYQKTIGTFDTLVTCRDYMNKIYTLTADDTMETNLVSNAIVSDIRDDINRSFTLCTMGETGPEYHSIPKKDKKTETRMVTVMTERDGADVPVTGSFDDITYVDKITHFDLMLYPFKAVFGSNTREEYTGSFTFTDVNALEIQNKLEDAKTLSHVFKLPSRDPEDDELACIKVYFQYSAKISTTYRVSEAEADQIERNIHTAIYKNFNMRQMTFGEELPYDNVLKVIETADARIKSVSLDDPKLEVRACFASGAEELLIVKSDGGKLDDTSGQELYDELVLREVLAGKIALWEYDTSFTTDYNEQQYNEDTPYITNNVNKLETSFTIKSDELANIDADDSSIAKGLTLKAGEVVQFRCPNFKTVKTYPAYVNYFLHLESDADSDGYAAPATFHSIPEFINRGTIYHNLTGNNTVASLGIIADNWARFISVSGRLTYLQDNLLIASSTDLDRALNDHKILFNNSYVVYGFSTASGKYVIYKIDDSVPDARVPGDCGALYYICINANNFSKWTKFLQGTHNLWYYYDDLSTANVQSVPSHIFYRRVGGSSLANSPGKLVDASYIRYRELMYAEATLSTEWQFFVPKLWKENITDNTDLTSNHTTDGLGKDAVLTTIIKNSEYALKDDEYLLINYTKSADDGTDATTVINETYRAGTIIRPNFDLVDSTELKGAGKAFYKTTGFSFESNLQPAGMYAFSTNEQVEIREPIVITLDNSSANIYWIKNNETYDSNGECFFFSSGALVYTLADGEYLYYTDAARQDFAYYGAGTEIVRKNPNFNLKKLESDATISADTINTYGLAAAIPWRVYNLLENKLKISEYRYINLTDGDTLISVTMLSGSEPTAAEIDSESSITPDITATPRDILGASYKLTTASTESSLPEIAITNISWQVSSKLELNTGPVTGQELRATEASSTAVKLDNSDDITPKIADGPVQIKTSKAVYGSGIIQLYNSDNSLEAFDVKAYKVANLMKPNGFNFVSQASGNFNVLTFKDMPSDSEDVALELDITLPKNKDNKLTAEGLISFYAAATDTDTENLPKLFVMRDVSVSTTLESGGYSDVSYLDLIGTLKVAESSDDYKLPVIIATDYVTLNLKDFASKYATGSILQSTTDLEYRVEGIYYRLYTDTLPAEADDWKKFPELGLFGTTDLGSSGENEDCNVAIKLRLTPVTQSTTATISFSYSQETATTDQGQTGAEPVASPSSIGLVYTSNGNGTCYVSGIGDCTDTNIIIPRKSPDGDLVTGIGAEAFFMRTSLKSVTIPDSVTSIGEDAFFGCDGSTFYAEAASEPKDWDENWKPTDTLVVWGCRIIASDGQIDVRLSRQFTLQTDKYYQHKLSEDDLTGLNNRIGTNTSVTVKIFKDSEDGNPSDTAEYIGLNNEQQTAESINCELVLGEDYCFWSTLARFSFTELDGMTIDDAGSGLVYTTLAIPPSANNTLNRGLNVVYLTESSKLAVVSKQSSVSLMFSPLYLVKLDDSGEKRLNSRLGFYQDTGTIITMINDLTANSGYGFLPNAPIMQGYGLELNPKDPNDTMRLAKNWFDTNSINNKFIVSEIDPDTLDTGIIVSQFSRR